MPIEHIAVAPSVEPDNTCILPLVAAQPGIWLAEQIAPDANAFSVAHYIDLSGDLDLAALSNAIRAGLAEADTIHATFSCDDDANIAVQRWPMPRSADQVTAPDLIDFSTAPDPEKAAMSAMQDDLARAPNANAGRPLFRHMILRVGSQRWFWYQRYHHICVDGYGFAALGRRIVALYTAQIEGREAGPSPFVDFGSVAAEYATYSASDAYVRDGAFWREQAATDNAPPILARHDITGVDVANINVHRTQVRLSADVLGQLAMLGKDRRLGAPEMAMAAILAYLHRMTGAARLSVGVPMMRRLGSVAIDSIGPTVNVLPLHVAVEGRLCFIEVAQRLAHALRGIKRHQRYDAEQIQRDLGLVGSGRALYGPTVNLKAYDPSLSLPGVDAVTHVLAAGPVEDMEFGLWQDGDGLVVDLAANPARYDLAEIKRHAARLKALVENLTRSPSFEVGAVDFLTVSEQQDIAGWSNGPNIANPLGWTTVIDAFNHHAARASTLTAISDCETSLDFATLSAGIARLARMLITRGIGPGDIVATAMPRRNDAVIATMATLAAGAAWMPLDPEYPAERLDAMCADAAPALILTTRALGLELGNHAPVMWLDDSAMIAALSAFDSGPIADTERRNPVTADDIAYIIYTSGSTGRPKGVMVPHRGLLNLLLAHQAAQHGALIDALHPRRVRAGHAMSFAFDSSWEQIFWLILGQELHICDEDQRRDAQALTEFVRGRAIDAIDLSPAMLQQMLDCDLLESAPRPTLLLVGGEAVPPALWERLRAADVSTVNLYGPTEFSVDSLGASLSLSPTPIIGRPVANNAVRLLDNRLQLVPVDVIGEIYMAGPGLAHGYLDRPALTAERFVADPFAVGERIYRTGDLGRWSADGQITYLGRSDHQVKIRGFRVELGEVEHAIAALPGVSAAMVLVRPSGATQHLVGYYTGTGDPEIWLATLTATLPAYMVPSLLVHLDAWPLTVNGKIDRAALPEPGPVTETEPGEIEYSNDEQRLLCEAMAAVIGVDSVRPDADFFNLGGDSIGAMALGTRLRRSGYTLRPRDVFALRRADRMAAAMEPIKARQNVDLPEVIGEISATPIIRWFGIHHGHATRFTHGALVRVPAALDRHHLEQGLAALIHAHPALRMKTLNGALNVLPFEAVVVASLVDEGDRKPVSPSTFDAAFEAASLRLKPETGRMIEAILWAGDHDEDGWVMIVIHHLATDGVSWRILLPELDAACTAAMAGRPPILTREDCSIHQWAALLDGHRNACRSELPLWREVLEANVPALAARALDPERDTLGTAHGRRLLFDAATTEALLTPLPNACRASVEELLLAALGHAVRAVFGVDRLRVSMESHGREMLDDTVDPSRTVGWLTAEYPILLDAPASAMDAVRGARQSLRRLASHGIGYGILRYLDVDFANLLGALEARGRPEFLFNYLGRFAADTAHWTPQAAGGRFADAFAVDADPAMTMLHGLELNAFIKEGATGPQLAINWTWAEGLFGSTQIEALHKAMAGAIEDLDQFARDNPLHAADTLVQADCPGLTDADLKDLRGRYGPLGAVLPLLPLQQGLLFHAQLGELASKYNSISRIDLDGPLDSDRLRAALDALLQHHPQLGARFDMHCPSGPWQVLALTPDHWPISEHHLQPGADETEVLLLEQAELERDFAVNGGLLVHACLIRRDEGRHTLLLNAHHLVVDGWSTPMMIRDFLIAYREGPEALTVAHVSYPAIVHALSMRDLIPARAAWAEAMDGAKPTLLFDNATAAPKVHETEIVLELDLEQALRARCREYGLTLNTVMQGMWGALLSILTGRDDVLFGTPVSGRTSPIEGVDAHIGLFSNTVPVRVTLNPGQSLLVQLATLQARQGALIEHDGLSLAEIQRIAGGSALFDTLLVSENYPADEGLLARDHEGLKVAGLNNRGYTHYPLTVMVLPGERLRLLIEHRDVLVDPGALADRIRALLEHIAFAGDRPWASFEPRLPHEIALMDRVNATTVDLPDQSLRDLLIARSADSANELAIVDCDASLTYAELHRQVRHLASRMQDAGVSTGDIVAIALSRSIRLTVAIHAVIEAGAAYLPLDTGYPAERLTLMIDDARPRLVVSETGLRLDLGGIETLMFDALVSTDTIVPETKAAPLSGDDAAYLIYTSGSTGRPKGALLSHRAIVNRLSWMQHEYRLTPDDRVLQKTPCSFDVSVWEFFWPLIEGATLVMSAPDVHRDPEALLEEIARERITTLHFVPSMLAAFLGWIGEDVPRRAGLAASLRQVFCSGEALSVALARQHEILLPHARLHNLYGPTEAAVDVTYKSAGGMTDGSGVPIGRPVWNTQVHILDGDLRPVPIGVAGELYLGGVQLAEYYLDRAELTATRFVADPFGHGGRLYRTGDIARWKANGDVEYLGRSDDQFKIRGQRIELGEIEAALLAQPGVAAAAAAACILGNDAADGIDARQVVGYVVPIINSEIDPEGLRVAVAERLPASMVPVTIMTLPQLPLSLNGKLDRKSLPLPSSEGTAGRAPRHGMESRIASGFARLLDLPSVQADDDFFALGGHSLLAMRLAAELRTALGRPVSVGQIMGAPSVARLAALLSDETAARDPANAGFGKILHLRGGRGNPIFCFHPASGFAWQYSGLARYFPRHLPIIGLQSPRPDGVIASSADLEAACAAQLESLRSVQPRGPYHLIGYSLGGTLAQGVAAHLQALGEEVAFLGLFDTYPPEGQDWSGATDGEAQVEADREREQFLVATEEDAEDADEKAAMFADIVANYADAVKLLAAGTTPRFEGRATLFVAKRTLPEGWDVEGCWAPFLAGLEVHPVDCAHEDIMSPAILETVGPALATMLKNLTSLA
jgi:amino acid adenylation domain-containing protein/non-ribosomal peptide synthase protein (TIGR01720 family)